MIDPNKNVLTTSNVIFYRQIKTQIVNGLSLDRTGKTVELIHITMCVILQVSRQIAK